ncbi:MAG: hypothetical protein WDM77_21575 [Steroidobacteraceae bacterium]
MTNDAGPAVYLSSGWMVWLRLNVLKGERSSLWGELMAQRLDIRSAQLTGEPVQIAARVGDFAASPSGILVYKSARIGGQRQLTWFDRSGTELGTVGEADDTLNAPRVAPDGHRVVVSRSVLGNRDLWLLEGARASRLTFGAGDETFSAWSPDGSRITFASGAAGNLDLYEVQANGAGGEKQLTKGDPGAYPSGWSSDGRYLLYFSANSSSAHINVLSRVGDQKPRVFLQSSFIQVWGQFSPDMRWVAYQSDESGRYEVYVRPFHPSDLRDEKTGSNGDGAQWLVSTAGGVAPMWSANGKELYYLNPKGDLMATSVSAAGSAFAAGTPVRLFEPHVWNGGTDNQTGRQYDVAPDGRFLINRTRDTDSMLAVTLLQNWDPTVSAHE